MQVADVKQGSWQSHNHDQNVLARLAACIVTPETTVQWQHGHALTAYSIVQLLAYFSAQRRYSCAGCTLYGRKPIGSEAKLVGQPDQGKVPAGGAVPGGANLSRVARS